MKFAIIAVGGKQYKVSEGKMYKFEKLNKKKDASITFDKILLYSDGKKTDIGKPHVKDITVSGTVIEQGRSRKVTVVKYKSKIRYKRTLGHRQAFTKVKITKIGTKK